MNGELLCFGSNVYRSLLTLTNPIQSPPYIAKLSGPDRRALRRKTIRSVISAAETYFAAEEFRLISLIEQLPSKVGGRMSRGWAKADQERDPIQHRRLIFRLHKSLSADDDVRRKLQHVVAGRLGRRAALDHEWLPLSLQFGAHLARSTNLVGAAFKKWIVRRPAKLREAAQTALESPWFKRTRGRRDQSLITEYVAAIDAAYHGWTGKHLSTSSSVRTRRVAPDLGHDLPGASLTFALGCLRPLFPDITVAAARHHIKNARKISA